MNQKYKPDDAVWRYTIGQFKCTIEPFIVVKKAEETSSVLAPVCFYEVKRNEITDDENVYTVSELALYASEKEAKAAMMAEMRASKRHHEHSILELASRMSVHSEEIARLDMLLDLYEDKK